MRIFSRTLAFLLAASLASPCSAESLLRFATPGENAPPVGQSGKSGGSMVRFQGPPRNVAAESASPRIPLELSPRASAAPRTSAVFQPLKATTAPRVAASPISLSEPVPPRLPSAGRRSLFLLAFRQRPTQEDAALDWSDLPSNPLPSTPAGDDALPKNEIPSRPIERGDNSSELRLDEPPRNVVPNAGADAAADSPSPTEDMGEEEGSDEPRWLLLDQSDTAAPLPPREHLTQDEAAPQPREITPEEYALVAPPGPPLPAMSARVGWEPLYPGDPWANYAQECQAGRGGFLGWFLSLLGVRQ